jgi:hypothetical protein
MVDESKFYRQVLPTAVEKRCHDVDEISGGSA